MEVTILTRIARPDGTPPRCAICGDICAVSILGPAYCRPHEPRLQGSDPATRRAMTAQANTARRRESASTQTAAIVAARAVIAETQPRTHRDRVNDRLRAKGLM